MEIKGSYKLIYSVDDKQDELTVVVELKQVETILLPRQNLYYGVATVNGKPYTEVDLSSCVNAKFMSQSIGKKIKNDIMIKCREDKKLFSIKKEETK